MSLNSQKRVRSTSNSHSKSKSKTSSEKILSQSAYNEKKEIKNTKFKGTINNNHNLEVSHNNSCNKILTKSNNVLSPKERIQPSKSNCHSVISNNSKMSPIDIHELGSDEKESILFSKK